MFSKIFSNRFFPVILLILLTIQLIVGLLVFRKEDNNLIIPEPGDLLIETIIPELSITPTNTIELPSPTIAPTVSVAIPTPTRILQPTNTPIPTVVPISSGFRMMKDVGEPYLDNFGLTDNDFQILVKHHINVIEGNFDICAGDADVSYLLNKAQQYGIKVIMNAGSGEAEWGYVCDVVPSASQKPVWSKNQVQAWVRKWKDYPAVLAWDTSNEAGLNFPNSNGGNDPTMFLTLTQLQTAYADVKAVDPNHPVIIRMLGWIFYEHESGFFDQSLGNPYGSGVADWVMINAYSNVAEYFPDFVSTVSTRGYQAVKSITPNVKFTVSLGAWEEPNSIFFKPTVAHLQNDIYSAIQSIPSADFLGLAFFKYGAANTEWYMPDAAIGAPDLFNLISSY